MFGPVDHYLYMGTGDGGGGGDRPNNAQNLDVMLGKIMRIDVDGTGAVPCGQSTPMPYAIPPTNPFVGVAGCDEIWAYGVRNPWRFWIRPFERGSLHRRGRPESLRGDRLSAGLQHRRRELRLAVDGGVSLLQPAHQLQRRLADPADPGGDPRPRGWCAIIGGSGIAARRSPGWSASISMATSARGRSGPRRSRAGAGPRRCCSIRPSRSRASARTRPGRSTSSTSAARSTGSTPVANPVPAVTNLNPDIVIAGDPGFTLGVTGTGFVDGSTVQWNGADRPTTFVNGDAPDGGDLGRRHRHRRHRGRRRLQPAARRRGLRDQAVLRQHDVPGRADELLRGQPDRGHLQRRHHRRVRRPALLSGALDLPRGDGGVPAQGLAGVRVCPAGLHAPGLFTDVPCPGLYTDWIEDMKTRGITAGCGDGSTYCPDADILRQEMAVFLLKTSQGSDYMPPACTPPGPGVRGRSLSQPICRLD